MCEACGNEHIIKRGGGIITVEKIKKNVEKIEKHTDLTALELSYKRISQEIPEIEKEIKSIQSNINALEFQISDHRGCFSPALAAGGTVVAIVIFTIVFAIIELFVNGFRGVPFASIIVKNWYFVALIPVLVGLGVYLDSYTKIPPLERDLNNTKNRLADIKRQLDEKIRLRNRILAQINDILM